MLDFRGKLVLAPMVRVSELPLRILSLRYGADLVWTPEYVDKKIIGTQRVVNQNLGTVDFRTVRDGRLIFRTAPALEKQRVIFQLGTADAELAVAAAKIVASDVAGIDVNSGCPKHFSVHAGMGAALLSTPEKLEQILRALVAEVGTPNNMPISVKIRCLESAEKTYELVERLVQTGISHLTVHCRTPPMRPREPAFYDYLKGIAERCHRQNVSCYVNGDVPNKSGLEMFAKYGVDGLMMARAAESNPSCFGATKEEELVPARQIAQEFLAESEKWDYNVGHAKYCITKMLEGRDSAYQDIARSKTYEALSVLLQQPEEILKKKRRPSKFDRERERQRERERELGLEHEHSNKRHKDTPAGQESVAEVTV